MITLIEGVIRNKGEDWLEVQIPAGVSLRVAVPSNLAEKNSPIGQNTALHTHLYTRDGILSLYGFNTTDDRDVFTLLLSISGIGPKAALSLISTLGLETLVQAIQEDNQTVLKEAPGIGARAAERVIVELRGKFDVYTGSTGINGKNQTERQDLFDALTNLGYSSDEARKAIDSLVNPNDLPFEEQLRDALKILSDI
ncbi:MAG: Holliday junction branch migration protein RuvA [SAR202 cluster bacterium]|nr:Holliday junction branch migration protein RuvA [SAR202 cluster bacterium]|tara:strand:+ start:336 stop:926 length:591 start_codon:yes stop_codon:yes gene_type:complete